jgi:putative peptidoglycan lipid II flippase
LGVAVSSVILPSLAKNHAAEDAEAFSKSLDWGLKLVLLIGMPATLGLVLLSKPLLATLFQYNEFGANDVAMASKSLMAFAIGLLAFVMIKVLVPGFTSRMDTRTPVRFGMYTIVCNVVLSLALVIPLAHAGIALATSLAAYLNAGLLLISLLKQQIYRPGKGWWGFMLRIVFACGMMSLFLTYYVNQQLWFGWSVSQRGLHLTAVIGMAILVYVISLALSGSRVRHLHAQ